MCHTADDRSGHGDIDTRLAVTLAQPNAQKPGRSQMVTDVEITVGAAHRDWRPKR